METFHIATLGTLFSMIVALPLSILAAHNITPSKGLNFLAKTLLRSPVARSTRWCGRCCSSPCSGLGR